MKTNLESRCIWRREYSLYKTGDELRDGGKHERRDGIGDEDGGEYICGDKD